MQMMCKADLFKQNKETILVCAFGHQIQKWQKGKNESSIKATAAWYKARVRLHNPHGHRSHKHKEFPKSLGWGKERKIRKQTGDGKKERVRCMERVTRKQTEEEPNRKGVEHFRWLRQSEVIANWRARQQNSIGIQKDRSTSVKCPAI